MADGRDACPLPSPDPAALFLNPPPAPPQITVQQNLIAKLPFCAFNGGNDVFVDIGNKCIGLDALMRYLGAAPPEVMHVGDRFTDSGNDAATRDVCSIVWVANPEETAFFIR
ncbi:IMP-specific 5'-nucleotidase 1 [Monoraphidium neglectum]|uniref:IMP-specific 5'-nucleotidase 1 n=1 Tax=Monoraphidium neglectum TaxID=145388 RepID=A0A0D2KAK1_9CHLO|nr:IMP-specific 5'-nucleotidase 1 [Monoraphidium neglectum]KIY93043.1 IMP-specific 5'-nucleotidase 1 [Monoraphidium neglectum]|eukprot:XP_013892063.1 IMP-specific 5'-nucleotidase 1 [Monoraphidium neglectum]